MGSTAFELREDYAGTFEQQTDDGVEELDVFAGAVVAVPPDGRSFDVKKELEKGDGLIVVEEAHVQLVDTLRRLPVLKEVEAPEDAESVSAYEAMTSLQLKEELERRELDSSGNKLERRERLEAADRGETPETTEEG